MVSTCGVDWIRTLPYVSFVITEGAAVIISMFFKREAKKKPTRAGSRLSSSVCFCLPSVSFLCTVPRFLSFCFQKSFFGHPSNSLHPRNFSHTPAASLSTFGDSSYFFYFLDCLKTNLFFFTPTFLSSTWTSLSCVSPAAMRTELGSAALGLGLKGEWGE